MDWWTWVFSGVGVAVPIAIVGWYVSRRTKDGVVESRESSSVRVDAIHDSRSVTVVKGSALHGANVEVGEIARANDVTIVDNTAD